MLAIFLGPIGFSGFPENAKPGIEGAIISKQTSLLLPWVKSGLIWQKCYNNGKYKESWKIKLKG